MAGRTRSESRGHRAEDDKRGRAPARVASCRRRRGSHGAKILQEWTEIEIEMEKKANEDCYLGEKRWADEFCAAVPLGSSVGFACFSWLGSGS